MAICEFNYNGTIVPIPYRVVNALQAAGYSDDQIYLMTPRERFDKFCEWEGLVNWGYTLWSVVHESLGIEE